MDERNTEKQQKTKKKGDLLLTLVLIIAIAVFCYAAFNLFHIYTEYKKGTDEYNHIEQMAVTDRAPDAQEVAGPEAQPKAPINVDFASLKSVNPDVVGWIYVEALNHISYPIVQGKDNETYLHQTYEGNYNFAGTLFIDYENSSDFNDCNTLVYGHNMKNQSMFQNLHLFRDKDFFDSHPDVYIYTPEGVLKYTVFASYTYDDRHIMNSFDFKDKKVFEKYLDDIFNVRAMDANIRSDVSVTSDDHIITLETCVGGQTQSRYLVQAVLNRNGKNE